MALVVCPECGNTVSSVAGYCIKCGYPIGKIIEGKLVNNILKDAMIEQLGLSVRAYRILKQAGICTVGDIISMNLEQLMQIENFGKKSLNEIISKVGELGFLIIDDCDKGKTPPSVAVTKLDWNCEQALKNSAYYTLEYKFSPEELALIKRGHKPNNFDDKWFIYYENSTVYFYRSWTGRLIYRLIIYEESNQHIVVFYYENEAALKEPVEQVIFNLIKSWLNDWE